MAAAAAFTATANVPVALVVGVILVTIAVAALDWLFHLDGFGLAKGLERRVINRVIRWLERFEPEV